MVASRRGWPHTSSPPARLLLLEPLDLGSPEDGLIAVPARLDPERTQATLQRRAGARAEGRSIAIREPQVVDPRGFQPRALTCGFDVLRVWAVAHTFRMCDLVHRARRNTRRIPLLDRGVRPLRGPGSRGAVARSHDKTPDYVGFGGT